MNPVKSIPTPSGKSLSFDSLNPDMINIRDIATSLSRIDKFGGMAQLPYSLAQSAVHLSGYFLAQPESAIYALLLNAHKTYTGHIPWFVLENMEKATLFDMSKKRAAIRAVMGKSFNLNMKPENTIASPVMDKEFVLRQAEIRDLINEKTEFYKLSMGVSGIKKIKPWNWQKAEEKFLERFEDITSLRAAA